MTARVRSFASVAAILALFLIPSPAHAQSALPAPGASAPPALRVSGTPTLQASTIALRPIAISEPAVAPSLVMQRNPSRGKTLMIVGTAMFIAGAIIGDDAGTIVMLGGAGVGLYGLYLYVQ